MYDLQSEVIQVQLHRLCILLGQISCRDVKTPAIALQVLLDAARGCMPPRMSLPMNSKVWVGLINVVQANRLL